MTIFHVLEKEVNWRREHGKSVGFDGMTKYKPLVAIGAEEPLHDRVETADYFRKFHGFNSTFSIANVSFQMAWMDLVASTLLYAHSRHGRFISILTRW